MNGKMELTLIKSQKLKHEWLRKNEKKWKWIENKYGKVMLEVHEHCQSKGNHHNAKNKKHVNKIGSKK
jgi:hypothetical protein